MGTKTISLSEDAYDRLKAEKEENESFSDTVRRLTTGVRLADYHGVLSDKTAGEIEQIIADRRAERTGSRRKRADRIADAFDHGTEQEER
jgi:predicted CopG family antitoxin